MAEKSKDQAMTEEQVQDALGCPCMDSMRNSPCGPQFMSSFECYLRSTAEVKGEECVALFATMQDCMEANKVGSGLEIST